MGLLRKATSWCRRNRKAAQRAAHHSCRLERMEPRSLLAADIQLGAVYYEDAGGGDEVADTIHVTWSGGAPGTQLTQLTIATDKLGDGLTIGDTFFDIAPGGAGAFAAGGLSIVAQDGFQITSAAVVDGGMSLSFGFTGFDANERLVLTLDVDEQGFLGANAVAEGNEFEGSLLTGSFSAPHYFDVSGSDIFRDAYDSSLVASGLDLPPDSYQPPDTASAPVRTAGSMFPLTQIPLPSSIAGTVYVDGNVDNVRSAGEAGIGGVQLQLLAWDGSSYTLIGRTATTGSQGEYRFDDLLPGMYRVVETQPNGYFSVGASRGVVNGQGRGLVTSADVLSDISLLGGEDSTLNDFAEALPGRISGRVHSDADGDCEFDVGETPLAGVTIQLLDSAGSTIATTVTDSQGQYAFENLRPGTYGVREVQPTGFFDSDDHAGSAGGSLAPPDSIRGINLLSGTNAEHYDFCELAPVELWGFVYIDDNNNGVFDSVEVGIGGVTLSLLGPSGAPLGPTTITAADGSYFFHDLAPGTYGVAESQPSGLFDGIDTPGGAGGSAANPGDAITGVVLRPGVIGRDYNFGELRPASVSGHVHADRNGDCLQQAEEPPLAGVTIQLRDQAGNLVATTVTDLDGMYHFDGLVPGTYSIWEVQPSGYFDSGDRVGDAGGTAENDRLIGITLGSGQNATGYDFCELEPASVAGMVFADRNNDSIQQPGEPGIAGVTIELVDTSGNTVATTTTDAAGRYKFSELAPQVYSIRERQPAGYFDGGDSLGTAGGTLAANDLMTNITLAPSNAESGYNFGELEPASLMGRVHSDLDGDCVFDANESPIQGVRVQLLDATGNILATALTDTAGRYTFSGLAPGTYQIRELQPAGFFDGGDDVGSAGGRIVANDRIVEIRLGGGVAATGYDFCEIAPASLSGFVFQDGPTIETENLDADLPGLVERLPKLRDGRRTADDVPISGVRLRLADATGRILLDSAGRPIEAVSDARGFYQFLNLPPGLYTVIEAQPAGYVDGLDTAGSSGGLALNASARGAGTFDVSLDGSLDGGINGTLARLARLAGNDAISQIPLAPGQASIENNFSEVRLIEVSPSPRLAFPPTPSIPPLPEALPGPIREPFMASVLSPILAAIVPPVYYTGHTGGYTWHLSVIDAGQPRGERGTRNAVVQLTTVRFAKAAWQEDHLNGAEWTLAPQAEGGAKRASPRKVLFGKKGGIPFTGDFDGDGVTDVGVFCEGQWFIDLNGNGIWDDEDLWARLGSKDDLPVTGDWDGDGKTDIGIFGRAWAGDPRAVAAEPGLPDPRNRLTGEKKNMPPLAHHATLGFRTMKRTRDGELRADVIDHVFHYGTPLDRPITGDWDGSGVDKIGVFHEGAWRLDVDGDGKWTESDLAFELGGPGDLPVIGDFDGDGTDDLGIYRNGTWMIDQNHDRRLDDEDVSIRMGGAGDQPVVGDWDGDGVDQAGVYQEMEQSEPADEAVVNPR